MDEAEEKEGLSLRVVFEKGGFGNPTRKEGKVAFLKRVELEVEGVSERNEDEEDRVEIEFNIIVFALCSAI